LKKYQRYALLVLSAFLLVFVFASINLQPIFINYSSVAQFFKLDTRVRVYVFANYMDNTTSSPTNQLFPVPSVSITLDGNQSSPPINSSGEAFFFVNRGFHHLVVFWGQGDWQTLQKDVDVTGPNSDTYRVVFYHYRASPIFVRVAPFPSTHSFFSQVAVTYRLFSQAFLFSQYIANTTFSYYTQTSGLTSYQDSTVHPMHMDGTPTTIEIRVPNTVVQLDTTTPVSSDIRSVTIEESAS
jgi:hypothetical protein